LLQKSDGEQSSRSRGDGERRVGTVLDEMITALAKGERVELRGLGALSVKARGARVGRNPRTGEAFKGD